jgi:hypothetical protein
LFSDPLVSLPSLSSVPPRDGPETVFVLGKEVFARPGDWRRLQSPHKRGTCPISRHRPRGWTSDLFSSQPRPELGGSPMESCLCPWKPSNHSSVL